MKKYTFAAYCKVIAFLINSDNLQAKEADLQPTDKIYTGEDIWNSNSHGELFGVIECTVIVDWVLTWKDSELTRACEKILAGETIEASKTYASTVGFFCMCNLWQMPPWFDKLIRQRFEGK